MFSLYLKGHELSKGMFFFKASSLIHWVAAWGGGHLLVQDNGNHVRSSRITHHPVLFLNAQSTGEGRIQGRQQRLTQGRSPPPEANSEERLLLRGLPFIWVKISETGLQESSQAITWLLKIDREFLENV